MLFLLSVKSLHLACLNMQQFFFKQDTRGKNILWTTEKNVELPIFMQKEGYGSMKPQTFIEMFEEVVNADPSFESLNFESEGKWQFYTLAQYRDHSIKFARALISLGIKQYAAVNIMGFNSPRWFISFVGSVYANCVPVGIYLTNNEETCSYIANHSECECLILDGLEEFERYRAIINTNHILNTVVFLNEVPKELIDKLKHVKCTFFNWKDFIELGKNQSLCNELKLRNQQQKPGNCCNIVYTSGTTGMPKGVLLSHDNLTFIGRLYRKAFQERIQDDGKLVSYLPLSHVAGQVSDMIGRFLTSHSMHWYQGLLR